MRSAMRMNLCAGAATAALALAALPAPAERVAVTAENVSGAARPAGPVTFGMLFAKGDMPADVAVRDVQAQVDVKRRWPDLSVKHAVVTVALPAMAAGESRQLVFEPTVPLPAVVLPPPPARDLLKDIDDLLVRVAIHGGPTRSASLKKVIAAGEPLRVWLAGPRVVEYHYKTAPAADDGQADPDLDVRFRVRCYPAEKAARIALIVENCHWNSPGNIPYDVEVLQAGKRVYARKNAGEWPAADVKDRSYIGHPKATRWIKRFWSGRDLGGVHVRYDRAYLNKIGVLGRYDTGLQVPEKVLAGMAAEWAKAPTDILQRGLIYRYFPDVGGRPDLGPLPLWASRYVLSQDPRALAATLGTGDLSGSCQIHFRDPRSDWIISLDEHPTYAHNAAGSAERVKLRDTADTPYVLPARGHFAVDTAHQPSLAFVPYLVTGDYYYLEEMQHWANWNMVWMNYGYREKEKGLLHRHQIRGTAWAIRQLVHAAALSPDDDPGKKYFESKLAANLAHLDDFVAGRLEAKPTPLGTYTLGAGFAYSGGWPAEVRDRYYSMPGWMHNFLAWSLACAADNGYAAAVPARNYLMKWTVGSFTHPQEITPFAGTAYFLFVGEKGPDGKPRWAQTWKDVARLSYDLPEAVPERFRRKPDTRVSYPDYGGSYSYIARGVLIEALRAGEPGAAEALKWLDAQLPRRREVLASDPTWAFGPAGEEPTAGGEKSGGAEKTGGAHQPAQ